MNELNVLKKPLSMGEMKRMMAETGQIEAIVPIAIADLIDYDFESFLDIISKRATGSDALMDIHYEAVQLINANVLAFRVTGDASTILDWKEEDAIDLRAALIKELEGLFNFEDGFTPEEAYRFTSTVSAILNQRRFKLPHTTLFMDWVYATVELKILLEQEDNRCSVSTVTIPYTYFDKENGEVDPLHQFVDDILNLI